MGARITVELDELLLLKADARGFSLLPRQPVSSLLAGRHASRLRGRGLSFEELRHYQQGDDIRTMDWKATARLRSPHVRVYTEECERPLLLLVDQRVPMFFGSRHAMKSAAAADLAALAAWRALDVGDRVGGLVFNEEEIVEVRPHRSQARVLQLFHEIVRLNQRLHSTDPPRGATSLNDALERAARVAKHDHLVVLISDLYGADDETKRLTTQIAAHNDVLVIAVYDPMGISLNGVEGMFAHDDGRTWELKSGSSFSKSFQAAFQERLEKWMQIFRHLRVPVLPISTAHPVPKQVRSLFGNRPLS
ncbi:DUF58 domain-containing protein [Planctomycetales bacterium 10988]|nr:DUF58 domain-containing protein [Planctomycetales bacterium 10988]